jgi:hypothetical protein
MRARILLEAEDEIERAFNDYEEKRRGLGLELLDEYRHSLEWIVAHPRAWQPLDETYRRCRLHRFPYGVIYRIGSATETGASDEIIIVAFMDLRRLPGGWQGR